MDVDVATTPDERGVGVIVDPPVVEDENNMVIFVLNMSAKEKPFTTQTAINCTLMFYKTSLLLKSLHVERIFNTHLRQLLIFKEYHIMSLRTYI